MCVVDMTRENDGSCCTDTNESGDRWLAAGNAGDDQRYRNCVMDPAGAQSSSGSRENGLTQMDTAIRRHMEPQQDSDFYYRPESAKIVFFLTDETADEAGQTNMCPNVPDDPADCHFFTGCAEHDPMGCMSVISNTSLIMQCSQYAGEMWSHPECSEVYRCLGDMDEDAWDPVLCDPLIAPYRQLLNQYNMVVYGLAILSTDPETCSPDSGTSPPMGYKQLIQDTGGILASLCQADLITTMELIIADIAGTASPMFLDHVPIPVSLAVAIERKNPQNGAHTGYEAIPRSRSNGFNYKASSNRIVLLNQPMDYPPYEVVVSYTRWVTQVIGPD
jgi:hypothetical protein